MTIQAMRQIDLDWVLDLNRAHETELSPLAPENLVALHAQAFAARVAEPQAAFLLAFDQSANYASPNYLWFRQRHAAFAYVDRIAVSALHRRKGLAGALYEDLFDIARSTGHTVVCCEVNSDPPNPGSDAFHAALGFEIVGEAYLDDRAKSVRYLTKRLD
ncbi:MAG: GNAT family N-acetyltransferase [Pseudomonadota bacterium]